MLAWIASHEFVLIGIVLMLVIGPAVGNYACSVVYRLPRGKTPFERHPFCGHCNANLQPIDLFPILSWCLTRGKCRYCNGAIPGVYTVIELVCGAAFIGYFLIFGMSELFLLAAAYATFVVIAAAIQWQQGWIAATIYSYAIALVLLMRTLTEHSIYGPIQGGFLMLIGGVIVHRLSPRRAESPFDITWIWWLVLLGAAVPVTQWLWLAPALLLAALLPAGTRLLPLATSALLAPALAALT